SVNQRLPSGPAVIPSGRLLAVMPVANSVTTPAGVIRSIRSLLSSVNQRLPSGPAVIPLGTLSVVIPVANSVTAPAGVTRPTRWPFDSVNQRLPSGPAVIPKGRLRGVGTGNSRIAGFPDSRQRASKPSTRGCRARQDRRDARVPALRFFQPR